MPLNFLSSSTSPFDDIIEQATSENCATENWDTILAINEKVFGGGSKAAKGVVASLKKRLNHRDPHVHLLALSVLDFLLCNADRNFKQEVCTREFVNEIKSKALGSNAIVAKKTKELIKKWANEFKADSAMNLLVSLYGDLKKDGHDFTPDHDSSTKKLNALKNAQKEEEELCRAIKISLDEQDSRFKTHSTIAKTGSGIAPLNSAATSSVYPSILAGSDSSKTGSSSALGSSKTNAISVTRRVKALYDFEAVEDNELTFKSGEIITVFEDRDENWWKGSTSRGQGLFPASFVTADLNVDVDHFNALEKKKSVQFDDKVKIETIEKQQIIKHVVSIDLEKINRCLEMLQNTDPTGERPDPLELPSFEAECLAMSPLIDADLANYDRQINQLSEANKRLEEALHLYHAAMADASNLAGIVSATSVPQSQSIPFHNVQQSPFVPPSANQYGQLPQNHPNYSSFAEQQPAGVQTVQNISNYPTYSNDG